jgi:hypothetical protein
VFSLCRMWTVPLGNCCTLPNATAATTLKSPALLVWCLTSFRFFLLYLTLAQCPHSVYPSDNKKQESNTRNQTNLTIHILTSISLQDVDGPIGRLLRSAQRHCGHTRVSTFACLCGVSPDGVAWPPQTWHFLLHVLHCLRLLLAGVSGAPAVL